MLDISQHPAIQNGQVTIDHSIPGMPHDGDIDPDKVRYCVVNPHSPSRKFAFPIKVENHLPQDSELFRAYIASESDAGVHPLT